MSKLPSISEHDWNSFNMSKQVTPPVKPDDYKRCEDDFVKCATNVRYLHKFAGMTDNSDNYNSMSDAFISSQIIPICFSNFLTCANKSKWTPNMADIDKVKPLKID